MIDVFAEAPALKFHDQVIRDFTKSKFESTIVPDPAITTAVDRSLLNYKKLVHSSRVTRQPIKAKIVFPDPLTFPVDKRVEGEEDTKMPQEKK